MRTLDPSVARRSSALLGVTGATTSNSIQLQHAKWWDSCADGYVCTYVAPFEPQAEQYSSTQLSSRWHHHFRCQAGCVVAASEDALVASARVLGEAVDVVDPLLGLGAHQRVDAPTAARILHAHVEVAFAGALK
eukprot:COSAG01_NODE_162_length_23597_cov_21.924130_12_plen_134_part_00